MTSSKIQRRFIAGAICPSCGQIDRIFVDSSGDTLACVSCDFREQRDAGSKSINSAVAIEKVKSTNVQSAPDLVRLVEE